MSADETASPIAARRTIEQVEKGLALALKMRSGRPSSLRRDRRGDGEVLMLGSMNREALQRTIATGEALEEVRAAIARCEEAGVPNGTVLAALTTELMPRLVEAYGPDGAAAMLCRLAGEISAANRLPALGP